MCIVLPLQCICAHTVGLWSDEGDGCQNACALSKPTDRFVDSGLRCSRRGYFMEHLLSGGCEAVVPENSFERCTTKCGVKLYCQFRGKNYNSREMNTCKMYCDDTLAVHSCLTALSSFKVSGPLAGQTEFYVDVFIQKI